MPYPRLDPAETIEVRDELILQFRTGAIGPLTFQLRLINIGYKLDEIRAWIGEYGAENELARKRD